MDSLKKLACFKHVCKSQMNSSNSIVCGIAGISEYTSTEQISIGILILLS